MIEPIAHLPGWLTLLFGLAPPTAFVIGLCIGAMGQEKKKEEPS